MKHSLREADISMYNTKFVELIRKCMSECQISYLLTSMEKDGIPGIIYVCKDDSSSLEKYRKFCTVTMFKLLGEMSDEFYDEEYLPSLFFADDKRTAVDIYCRFILTKDKFYEVI